jgi:hypothetical protein
MNEQVVSIAKGFRVTGIAFGLPSLVAFLYFGVGWLTMRLHPSPPASSNPVDLNSPVGLLEGGARLVGGAFRVLGGIAEGIMAGLAVASLCILIFSGALLLTGRGLGAQAGWARVVACLLMGLSTLVSGLIFLSVTRRGLLGMLALCVSLMSGWALWTLWKKFA